MARRLFLVQYPSDAFRDIESYRGDGERLKKTRNLVTQVHQTRDALPGLYLTLVCTDAGYLFRPNQVLHGVPKAARDYLQKSNWLAENTSALSPQADDLVLLTTRPPLNDEPVGRRWLARSGHQTETEIFDTLRKFFTICSRTQIEIRLSIALPPEAEWFRNLVFHKTHAGRINRSYSARVQRPWKDDVDLTMGYLVGLPRVGVTGYRVLAMWGAGGLETLALAGLLTGRFRDTLKRAIAAAALSLWLIPFRSPGRVPYPWLAFPDDDLRPGSLGDWSPLGPYHP